VSATILPGSPVPGNSSSMRGNSVTRRRRFFGLLRPSSSSNTEAEQAEPNPEAANDQLQIAVLISLPSPASRNQANAPNDKGKEKDTALGSDAGEVVFGLTEVPWSGGSKWPNDPKNGRK
jgi:hypothetical protein